MKHVQALIKHAYERQMMDLEQARFELKQAKEEVDACQKEVARLEESTKEMADFLAGKPRQT